MNIYYSLTLCQCTIIKETCRVPVLFENAPDIHTRAFTNIFSINYLCILFFNKDRKFCFRSRNGAEMFVISEYILTYRYIKFDFVWE